MICYATWVRHAHSSRVWRSVAVLRSIATAQNARIRSFRHLKMLNVKGTHLPHLDQRNILEYFSNSGHHPLEFYGCKIMDDDRLLMLVELCPTVRELNIAFSSPLFKYNGTHFPPSDSFQHSKNWMLWWKSFWMTYMTFPTFRRIRN